jgi:hypothetical protein
MYTIRVTPEGRLQVEASGRLGTAEALRMASQGFALAEAGGITDLLVDVRGVERGPGQWLVLGAVISSRLTGPMRLAVVAGPGQEAVVRRILRYSGLRSRATVVMTEAEALRWFAGRFPGRQAGPAGLGAAEPGPSATGTEGFRPRAG